VTTAHTWRLESPRSAKSRPPERRLLRCKYATSLAFLRFYATLYCAKSREVRSLQYRILTQRLYHAFTSSSFSEAPSDALRPGTGPLDPEPPVKVRSSRFACIPRVFVLVELSRRDVGDRPGRAGLEARELFSATACGVPWRSASYVDVALIPTSDASQSEPHGKSGRTPDRTRRTVRTPPAQTRRTASLNSANDPPLSQALHAIRFRSDASPADLTLALWAFLVAGRASTLCLRSMSPAERPRRAIVPCDSFSS
jgi:hypothetical protein